MREIRVPHIPGLPPVWPTEEADAPVDLDTPLNEKQVARASALYIAREILGIKNSFELIKLARYIETGVDPYAPKSDS